MGRCVLCLFVRACACGFRRDRGRSFYRMLCASFDEAVEFRSLSDGLVGRTVEVDISTVE